MTHTIEIVRFTPLTSAHHVVALAEVEHAGLRLRGLKLERRRGTLWLGMPGRKIAGGWQVVYEPVDEELYCGLRDALVARLAATPLDRAA